MKISVCVPVYNESVGIEKFLKSMENQTDKDFELVVVDNNSTDNTLSLVEEFAKGAAYKIKVLSERQQGVGHARATGASHALENGFEILAGTDCDCDISPQWVESIRYMFEVEKVSVAAGKYIHSIPKLKELISELLKVEQQKFIYYFELNNFILQHILRKPLLTGSNFAVLAEAYIKAGGFQQPYKDGKPAPLEDHELGKRLYDNGYKTVYMKFNCPSNPRRILHWLIQTDGPVEVYGPALTYIRKEDFAGLLHNVTEDRLKFRIRRVLYYNVLSPISKFETQITKEMLEWFFGLHTDELLQRLESEKLRIENSKDERLKFMDELLDIYFPYILNRIEEKFKTERLV